MAETKKGAKATRIMIPAPNVGRIRVRIRGLTPLMQNRWRESVVDGMRKKQEGTAKNKKEARKPEAEIEEILHAATISGTNGNRVLGHPSAALVEAMASAGHRMGDDWKNKGPTIKGAITILAKTDLVAITGGPPITDTRPGRIGGTWTIAHRPRYDEWGMEFTVEFDRAIFTEETFLHLLMLAGRNVGIGSYRVERGGQYGKFEVVSAELQEAP